MINTDISIYVPVYNGEKTIEKCVNSILNQTLKPKNILIINDCSNDVFFALSHGVHRGVLKSGKNDDRASFIKRLIDSLWN